MTTLAPAQTPQQPTAQTGDVPAQDAFQSRPFAEQPLQPEHTAPDIRPQHTTAQPVGHHFGNIPVFPPVQPVIQPKLTVGAAGDKYEREADRISAQVVKIINGQAASKPLQQESMEDRKALHMQPIVPSVGPHGGLVSPEVQAGIQHAKGGGQALDSGIQQCMSQAMGTDFSSVRVHTDTISDRLNDSIQAKAFTTGRDIFFKDGAYTPSTKEGKELIAHELTHVLQQGGGDGQRQAHGVPSIQRFVIVDNNNKPINNPHLHIYRQVTDEEVKEENAAQKPLVMELAKMLVSKYQKMTPETNHIPVNHIVKEAQELLTPPPLPEASTLTHSAQPDLSESYHLKLPPKFTSKKLPKLQSSTQPDLNELYAANQVNDKDTNEANFGWGFQLKKFEQASYQSNKMGVGESKNGFLPITFESAFNMATGTYKKVKGNNQTEQGFKLGWVQNLLEGKTTLVYVKQNDASEKYMLVFSEVKSRDIGDSKTDNTADPDGKFYMKPEHFQGQKGDFDVPMQDTLTEPVRIEDEKETRIQSAEAEFDFISWLVAENQATSELMHLGRIEWSAECKVRFKWKTNKSVEVENESYDKPHRTVIDSKRGQEPYRGRKMLFGTGPITLEQARNTKPKKIDVSKSLNLNNRKRKLKNV